jgi:muramoyltetrapeptide carboxypeptidase LdcA involved in peptidoglycan recycling
MVIAVSPPPVLRLTCHLSPDRQQLGNAGLSSCDAPAKLDILGADVPLGPVVLVKPQRLQPGDTVAVLSPSWGGPARFPATFEAGIATLASLDLRVREYPSTRSPDASIAERVADIHSAYSDPGVRAVIASIGGDDSVSLLPHLDSALLAAHPKIMLGYSDTCTLLCYLRALNQVAFHGPSVMGGLAQAGAYPPVFLDQLRALLFEAAPSYEYPIFGIYCEGYEDWSKPGNAVRTRPLLPDSGPKVLQGSHAVRGRLWGGCLEVLEILKGTSWWPRPEAWADAVVFLEGSEEAPPPELYARALRSWTAAGNLVRVKALLVGRPRGYSLTQKRELETVLRSVIALEAGRPDMVIVANCDFGHTDPQWLLPIGCMVEVETRGGRVKLLEAPVR